jgi:uncharacterized protein YbjT (DUF2867 family)
MFMERILVIGATGNIGRQVVSQLAASGAQVRAMTRKPDAAGLAPQIEVMRGDLTFLDSLDGCLSGIDAVFLVWTAPAAAVVPALDHIARRVRRIVFLSAPIKTPHPLFQQPNPHRVMVEQIEQLIEAAGVEWTFLRPGMLAANALGWWAPQIRSGDVVRWPYADVPTAPVHERDVAAVAIRALCENGHAGAEYVLTGPQSLTHAEQVSTIGRAIGRPLRLEEASPAEWRNERLSTWPAVLVDMLLDAWAAAAGHAALVTSTVAEITGAPPHTFFDWATDHADEFQAD